MSCEVNGAFYHEQSIFIRKKQTMKCNAEEIKVTFIVKNNKCYKKNKRGKPSHIGNVLAIYNDYIIVNGIYGNTQIDFDLKKNQVIIPKMKGIRKLLSVIKR